MLLGLLLLAGPAPAADLAVTGSWSVSITSADLQSGAGSDLAPTLESATAEVTLDLTSLVDPLDAWRVDVARADSSWPSGVQLWVQRTSDGSGLGTVTGGTSWQEVTSSGNALFSGTGNRSTIGIQLKLTGLSIDVSPSTYLTSVTYTLVDTP